MPRRSPTFRQRDLTAAVKAMRAAGCEVARVEVDKSGRISVILVSVHKEQQTDEAACGNEWDAILDPPGQTLK